MLLAVLFAGIFSVWAAILYFHLRHAGLSALVLVAPLPFLFAACLLWRRFAGATEVFAEIYVPASYVLGVILAQMVAARIARGICDGLTPRIAVGQALGTPLKVFGPVALCFLAWMLLSDVHPFVLENIAAAAAVALAAALAGTSIVMLLAAAFPYTEPFIARFNHAREERERLMDHLLFVTEPRWSLSLAGVVLIFVALSVFGMRPLQVQADPWLVARLALLAVFVLGGALGATRDWRLAIAETLTLFLLGAFGFWAFARGFTPLLRDDVLVVTILLATVAVPLTAFAVAASNCLRDGDDIVFALSHSLQERGAEAVLSAGLTAVPWIVFAAAGASVRSELAIAVTSCFAVPLIFPALAGAIYALLPRYRTVDEVFGKR